MRGCSLVFVVLLGGLVGCVGVIEGDGDDAAGSGLGDADRYGGEVDDHGIGTSAARVCAQGETLEGIDVSKWQGTIDWQRVAGDGISFAFIRLNDGTSSRDPQFARNWQGARDAGVVRGMYQYFRPAGNVATQASIMIEAMQDSTADDLPPVIDVENDGGLAPTAVAARVGQWIEAVQTATGRTPIIYTGKFFWRDEVRSLAFGSHALWIAQYTQLCPDIPDPWTRWTFWQLTDNGRVAGISGPVDVDRFDGTIADLAAFVAAN